MKKLLIFFIAFAMMFTFASCNDNNTDEPDNKTNKTDKTDKNDKSNNKKNSEDDSDVDINASLFTLKFDDNWVNVEDDFEDDEYGCYAVLKVPDPEDEEYYLIKAIIDVSVNDPYDFREDLVYYGFNQYEYKVNNAYETVNIGGVDLLKYDDGDDTLIYFNRVEEAGVTVSVEFDAVDINDSNINALLEGIAFNLEDTGNVDGPWEWEGEPFSADNASMSAGDYTIETSFVPFEEYISTFETFDHYVTAVGDKVYVLVDGELRECIYKDTKLSFVQKIDLPEDDYDRIEATADGKLWVSGGLNDVVCIKDGSITTTYEDIDNLAIHPSGAWGVDFFTSNECNIVTFSGDTFTKTPIKFAEADTIMHLTIDENNIYVCASAVDESGHKVFIYNKEGKLQKTLCNADGEGLGSITYVTQTKNGYIGFDGNMRDVLLWDNSGKFIAELSDSDLFNTNYPWFCASTTLDDGSILTIMTDDRADKSATELVAFVVKGF